MLTPTGQKELQDIRHMHFKQGNAMFYDGPSFAGSTANIVLVTHDYIYCANAGDSRSIAAIRSHPDILEVRGLSNDHKPWLPGQQARITRAGGFVNKHGRINNNLNLSRAIGDFDFKTNHLLPRSQQIIIPVPEVTKTLRRDVQFILMGCDGIWQTKDNQQMGHSVVKKLHRHRGHLQQVLAQVLQEELSPSMHSPGEVGLDNMTGILVYFHHI